MRCASSLLPSFSLAPRAGFLCTPPSISCPSPRANAPGAAFLALSSPISSPPPSNNTVTAGPHPCPFLPRHTSALIWEISFVNIAAPLAAPRSGRSFVVGVDAPPAAPRGGGTFVVDIAAPSAAPCSGENLVVGADAPPAAPCGGGTFVIGVDTPSATPRSGGTFVVGVDMPSAAPRSGGTFVVGVVMPSAAPRSGGTFVVGVDMPSTAPRSGGTFAVGVDMPSAAPRSGGTFVVGVDMPSAAPRSGGTFVVGVDMPSAAPRSGGTFVVGVDMPSAARCKQGIFSSFLFTLLARRIHVHVFGLAPSIPSVLASGQVPRVARRGTPPRLRSDAYILPASFSSPARISYVDMSYLFGVSKTLCHELVEVFLTEFPSVFKAAWVRFPTGEELPEMAREFAAIKGVPAVVGAVDGTHIHMKRDGRAQSGVLDKEVGLCLTTPAHM
ncbi:unnamed protein product [Closterium sp. NIES-65]|nr:unnamed protein product [Closterium sp. NIES-65]